VKQILQAAAAAQQRDILFLEVRNNLLKEERVQAVTRFRLPHFKRVAKVLLGQPSADYLEHVYEQLRKEKQEKADADFELQRQQATQQKLLEMQEKQAEWAQQREAMQQEAAAQAAEGEAVPDAAPKEEAPKDTEAQMEVDGEPEPPRVELTEEEKKQWYKRSDALPDLAPQALSACFVNFSLPDEKEGFDEVLYPWQSPVASEDYLRQWIQENKLTTRIEDLQPSEWFKEKWQKWQKDLQGWHAKHVEFKEPVVFSGRCAGGMRDEGSTQLGLFGSGIGLHWKAATVMQTPKVAEVRPRALPAVTERPQESPRPSPLAQGSSSSWAAAVAALGATAAGSSRRPEVQSRIHSFGRLVVRAKAAKGFATAEWMEDTAASDGQAEEEFGREASAPSTSKRSIVPKSSSSSAIRLSDGRRRRFDPGVLRDAKGEVLPGVFGLQNPREMADMSWEFEALAVVRDPASGILEVALNRPKALNAFNRATRLCGWTCDDVSWTAVQVTNCFEMASEDPETRCVLLHGGESRLFTAGLDLKSEIGGFPTGDAKLDVSRKAFRMEPIIKRCQEGISSIERCRKPVVVALHNGIVGAGVDLASACDIRYCTEDAWFSIAEVNVGLAADVGTLQRLPKIVGNDSVVRELAFTGRRLAAAEAKELGLVGKVLPSREVCLAEARKIAQEIASKSPVAVVGTKVSLNYSRDHSVQEGLDQILQWNSIHLMSEDLMKAAQASLMKTKENLPNGEQDAPEPEGAKELYQWMEAKGCTGLDDVQLLLGGGVALRRKSQCGSAKQDQAGFDETAHLRGWLSSEL
ncbi:Ech1, partial [Symbiodinium natans]